MNKPSDSTFANLLGLTFIVLKLCSVIHWSWWWVTLPIWGNAVGAGFYEVLISRDETPAETALRHFLERNS